MSKRSKSDKRESYRSLHPIFPIFLLLVFTSEGFAAPTASQSSSPTPLNRLSFPPSSICPLLSRLHRLCLYFLRTTFASLPIFVLFFPCILCVVNRICRLSIDWEHYEKLRVSDLVFRVPCLFTTKPPPQKVDYDGLLRSDGVRPPLPFIILLSCFASIRRSDDRLDFSPHHVYSLHRHCDTSYASSAALRISSPPALPTEPSLSDHVRCGHLSPCHHLSLRRQPGNCHPTLHTISKDRLGGSHAGSDDGTHAPNPQWSQR